MVRSRIDGHELGVRESRESPGAVEYPAVRCPSYDRGSPSFKGMSLRRSACNRHRVDLPRTFIGGTKGHGLAVRGDGRPIFFSRMAGQATGDTAGKADTPQVTFGREDDRVRVDRRKPEVSTRSLSGRLCGHCGQNEKGSDEKQQRGASSVHGGSLSSVRPSSNRNPAAGPTEERVAIEERHPAVRLFCGVPDVAVLRLSRAGSPTSAVPSRLRLLQLVT